MYYNYWNQIEHHFHNTWFQELAKSLKSERGKLHPVKCDITSESDIKEAFQWIKKHLGGVDILVNNAGVVVNSPLTGQYMHNVDRLTDRSVRLFHY